MQPNISPVTPSIFLYICFLNNNANTIINIIELKTFIIVAIGCKKINFPNNIINIEIVSGIDALENY